MKRVKRLLALVLVLAMAMSLMPGALAAGSPYTDVPAGHWAEDYIADVTEQGLMDGVGDGRFSPSGAMDRAMFVVVLARMAGAETDNTAATGFSDVAENQYYTGAVAWASGLGIVRGYENGTFGPKRPVTREQAATFLVRYAQVMGLELEPVQAAVEFTDGGSSTPVNGGVYATGDGFLSHTWYNREDSEPHGVVMTLSWPNDAAAEGATLLRVLKSVKLL